MPAALDLIGQDFNNLHVLERAGSRKGSVYWLCICKCGKTVKVQGSRLKSGHTKSCGCSRSSRPKQRIDLTNQRFGRLTALRSIRSNKAGNRVWLCVCDCGKTKEVTAAGLRFGQTRSCGCLNGENSKKLAELDGERFGRLVVVKCLGSDKHKKRQWLCLCDCGNTSVITTGQLRKGTQSCGCLRKEMLAERNRNALWDDLRDDTTLEHLVKEICGE